MLDVDWFVLQKFVFNVLKIIHFKDNYALVSFRAVKLAIAPIFKYYEFTPEDPVVNYLPDVRADCGFI